jgi:hypothetical protein
MPPGRNNSRWIKCCIPLPRRNSRVTVNVGGFKGRAVVNSRSESSPSSIGASPDLITDKSSRSGNERIKLRIGEGRRVGVNTLRDLMTGENPWNGIKGVFDSSCTELTTKRTTREGPVIQPPASASATVTTSELPTNLKFDVTPRRD